MEDSEEVLRALETTPSDKPIDIVLDTPGGLVIAALQIARAIQARKGSVRVIIPYYAMSGNTLIALAADEIIMSKNTVLGPLDPQMKHYPAPALANAKSQKKIGHIENEPLIYANVAQKAINQLREATEEFTSQPSES